MAVADRRYWAVIPAAGIGSRMATDRPKQYLPLGDRAVIEWALQPFLSAPWIDGVVVALSTEDEHFATLPVAGHPRIVTVTGGGERSDSVFAALQWLRQRTDAERIQVLVHDAARVGLSQARMLALREQSGEAGALLALPSVDTIKQSAGGSVERTLDRRTIWLAQTPQLFSLTLLFKALSSCREQGIAITDDASAVEQLGLAPALVPGSPANLKITHPQDLALAEFWLRQSGRWHPANAPERN